MKTYKFNKEFEKKLRGVKRKFMKNINENVKRTPDISLEDKINALNEESSFYGFMTVAFIWANTLEGHHFWSKMAHKE